MSVSFLSKKCDSCGGSLEYIKAEKIWRCRYCGQEVVREQQYDGLFTIKNVARQCLLDTANRRMEQAEKNLSECEKIDSAYVGSVIARISYRLIAVITPDACRTEQAAGMYQRLKEDYSRLRESGTMQEEEEDFYEFVRGADGASDVLALLILVFDTLGDEPRTEYLFQMLEPARIYSRACNLDLLTYAVRHERLELTRQIVSNKNNLDAHGALDVILAHCPDGTEKAEMAQQLLKAGAYTDQDRRQMQQYLTSSDSVATKAAILSACRGTGAMPDIETVIRYVLAGADGPQTGMVLDGLLDGHLYDAALYELTAYALEAPTEQALQILQKIDASGQFVSFNGKYVSTMIGNTERPAADRLRLLDELQKHPDNGALEFAASGYLCSSKDTAEDRVAILDRLFETVDAVNPVDVEEYLKSNTGDGAKKPEILKKVLSLKKMNPALLNRCMESYCRSCPDTSEVRQQVLDVMLDAGMNTGSAMMNELICAEQMDAAEKVELLRRLEANGCTLRTDALSTYLEKYGAKCEEAMLDYLFHRCSFVSEKALTAYVLNCAHDSGAKAQNAAALAAKLAVPFGSSACTVQHLGNRISCSLAQAYLLTAADSYETASALLQMMAAQTRLNADIQCNGRTVRLKKYVKENKASLTPLTEQLCDDNRLFSMF